MSNIQLGQNFIFTLFFTIIFFPLIFYLFWSVFQALIAVVVGDHFLNHSDHVGCFLLIFFMSFYCISTFSLGVLGSLGSPR
jgi:hypothetical protein